MTQLTVGRIEFAHPRAAECFPIPRELAKVTATGPFAFVYLDAEPIPPAKRGKFKHHGGMLFKWGMNGCGFGELSMIRCEDGTWSVDDEHMGQDFVSALLAEWGKRVTQP